MPLPKEELIEALKKDYSTLTCPGCKKKEFQFFVETAIGELDEKGLFRNIRYADDTYFFQCSNPKCNLPMYRLKTKSMCPMSAKT